MTNNHTTNKDTSMGLSDCIIFIILLCGALAITLPNPNKELKKLNTKVESIEKTLIENDKTAQYEVDLNSYLQLDIYKEKYGGSKILKKSLEDNKISGYEFKQIIEDYKVIIKQKLKS